MNVTESKSNNFQNFQSGNQIINQKMERNTYISIQASRTRKYANIQIKIDNQEKVNEKMYSGY